MPFGPVTPLESLRRSLRLSQTSLAELAGVDRSLITRAEAGAMPSTAVRDALAGALKTTSDVLWPTVAFIGADER
jgi:transcriptional regulator with XRE-family HTH domain